MMFANLCTRKIGPQLWQLTHPLSIHNYLVPAQFYTDGASNIRLLWAVCSPMTGRHAEPSVLHDWLYSLDCPLKLTRKEADLIYLEAMKIYKVNPVLRTAIYRGVRLGGSGSFKKIHSIQKCHKKNLY